MLGRWGIQYGRGPATRIVTGLSNSPKNIVSQAEASTQFGPRKNKKMAGLYISYSRSCSGRPNKVLTFFSEILVESWSGTASIGFGSPRRRICQCFCARSIFDGQFRAQIQILESSRKKSKKVRASKTGYNIRTWLGQVLFGLGGTNI